MITTQNHRKKLKHYITEISGLGFLGLGLGLFLGMLVMDELMHLGKSLRTIFLYSIQDVSSMSIMYSNVYFLYAYDFADKGQHS